MFVQHCNKTTSLVLFIVCVENLYLVKILDKLSTGDSNTECMQSNSNLNFKTKVQKFELRLTSLVNISSNYQYCYVVLNGTVTCVTTE